MLYAEVQFFVVAKCVCKLSYYVFLYNMLRAD